MHGCQKLVDLNFHCFDWKKCVEHACWVERPPLPVPPAEVIARGTRSVFQFVKAVLQGGSFTSRSCRVMVVGPQMVRAHTSVILSSLTAASGWQDESDQRAEGRPVPAHPLQQSNGVHASYPAAVGRGRPAHMGLCRCSARCRACAVTQAFDTRLLLQDRRCTTCRTPCISLSAASTS